MTRPQVGCTKEGWHKAAHDEVGVSLATGEMKSPLASLTYSDTAHVRIAFFMSWLD